MSTSTTEPVDPDLPDLIAGRFRPTRLLGAGSYAQTFAAGDSHTGDDVALKLLSFELLSDWKSLELFEREAQVWYPAAVRMNSKLSPDTSISRWAR